MDEAYIASPAMSPAWCWDLERFPNLVILRTLSKAYVLRLALAAGRCSHNEDIIRFLLARVITPFYALPTHTIDSVLHLTDEAHVTES